MALRPDPAAWLGPGYAARTRRRRLAVAVALALAVGLTVQALRPSPPAGIPVVVVRHDLPAGHRLTPADVVRRAVVRDDVPAAAARDPTDVTGRRVALPMRAGEVVTDVRLLGPGLLSAYGPDAVAVPVRIPDAAAVRLLRPGDRIDVLAADADSAQDPAAGARPVAVDVPVLTVPPPDPDAGGSSEGGLVVVATTAPGAQTLAAAAAVSVLSVSMRARSER